MTLVLRGIKVARTKAQCQRSGGVWRKGVRGVRRGSCAIPSTRSPGKRARANLARFVKRGTKCRAGEKRILVKSPTNPRGTQSCVPR